MSQVMMQINRDALFAKLNTLNIIYLDEIRIIPCSAFIEITSSAASRDKRIISDYTSDEVILYERKRHFTPAGVLKYLDTGHLINYVNLCEWLKIKPDPYHTYNKDLKKMLRGNLYITSSLCRFLFGKRKNISILDTHCTLPEFLNCLTIPLQIQAIPDRLKYLHTMHNAQ